LPQTILAILFEIGTGTVKAFFPHPYSHEFCEHKKHDSYYSAISRLKRKGLIAKNKKDIFYLTKKGENEAFFAYINAELSGKKFVKQTQKKWDGKWRIILFDIPEKQKRKRNYLRMVIKTLGFKEFQKSIWIYPYKIPDFLLQLLGEENIAHHVRFMTSASLDYDHDLKNVFGLH